MALFAPIPFQSIPATPFLRIQISTSRTLRISFFGIHGLQRMGKVPFCEVKYDIRIDFPRLFQKYFFKNQPESGQCPFPVLLLEGSRQAAISFIISIGFVGSRDILSLDPFFYAPVSKPDARVIKQKIAFQAIFCFHENAFGLRRIPCEFLFSVLALV